MNDELTVGVLHRFTCRFEQAEPGVNRQGSGIAPVVEERIGELTSSMVTAGRLTVADDSETAVLSTDISIVCVGTPSAPGGGLSTGYLERVSDEIGTALATKNGWHVVVFRSTMVPGTCETVLIPALERTSGKRAGVDFGVCVNPDTTAGGAATSTPR